MTATIPPDNRAAGDGQHIQDHNDISDVLAAQASALATETSRAETAEGALSSSLTAETSRAKLAETERGRWANAGSNGPSIITLWGGQADETVTTSGTGTPTVMADTTNYALGTQAWKLSMAGAGTGAFVLSSSFTPPPIAAIGAEIYIPDMTNVSQFFVEVVTTGGTWKRKLTTAAFPQLVNGWNRVRWGATQQFGSNTPSISLNSAISAVEIVIVSTGATTATVGRVWAECPPKAQLVVIADGAYNSEFVQGTYGGTSPGGISFVGGYPDLKAFGIPVVWAPDTGKMGTSTPPTDRATWAQMAAVMADGNGNEMNYHGSTGGALSSATTTQTIAETMAAIKALQQNGYPNPPIKAAWVQNSAPNAAACKPFMLGYRTPGNTADDATSWTGTPVSCWPPMDMWNIPCQELDATVDWVAATTGLQATHGICITYLHGIDPNGTSGAIDGTTPAQWGLFLDFIAAGLSGGWLEGVTFQQLMARDGYKYRRTSGQWTHEYVDTAGALQHVKLP
jgi:hypothetical protein